MIKKVFILSALFLLPFIGLSQQKEDVSKMFRDVVNVQVDRSKFAPAAPPTPAVTETVGKKGKKKKVEIPVEPTPDTLSAMIPAPMGEIVKRAQNWTTLKHLKFTKSGATNAGNTISCNVTFPYKQKVLNPENAVDGSFTMDVIIEAKEGKYRYTIKNIKHIALKPGMSGGDIYAAVPEAGSMSITDNTWKRVRSEAFTDAKIVIEDLKAKMAEGVETEKDEW